MSVILTLTATLPGGGPMTATTSGIAQTDILAGTIVGVALLVSLVVTELLSSRQVWTKTAAATVHGINVTLLIIFCVSVAFNVARLG
jgi:hypothetical protein